MIARIGLLLLAVLGGFGLAGCIGSGGYSQASVQPSQEILDGTIRNPADWNDPPRRTARRNARVTIGAVNSETEISSRQAPAVYSDEWWEREKRENDRLTRQMQICRGC